ncbi:MAG: hypothetical protein ABIG87_00300 [Patescibacteria group bacterium]
MQKIPVKKIILMTVAVVGLIGVAVLAPNALQVIKQFSGKNNYNRKKYLNNSIGNLLRQGFIAFEIKGGKKFIKLTEKGEIELAKYKIGDLKIKQPKKWDKKWRVVIFDIKEKRKRTRDLLRGTLNRLGFVKLQNSVWVFPYDCEELVIMLKSNLFVGKDVLYMTVEKIENDKWLKETFNLCKSKNIKYSEQKIKIF